MPIEFRCEKCNRKLRVPDAASGKKARCQCGNIILVPVANEDTQTIVSHPDSTTNRQQNLPVAEALDTKQIPSAELKSDADATLLSPSSEIKSAPHAPFDDKASNDATMVAPSNDSTIMKPIGDNDQTLLAPTPSQSRVTEGFTRAPEKQFSDTAGGAKYFGQYQIVSELGRGGMGVVYKARDPKLNREVAIKVLIAGEDASVDAIKRFHKEAEATAKLQHPNVVSIFDIGIQGNQHYFAMEFVKGKPLNEIIKSGDMKTSDKLALMAKVAKAMDYCHQQGILHRDLKPANIFVTPNGEPKIMDFGLAKSTESDDAHLTRTGTIMGTPSYMSPEQAESSKDIDARTDVWALGVILYEMLCGEVPFKGNSSMEVLTKVAVDEPVPPIKRVKINNDLNTIVMKCLEKSKDTRYQTAQDVASDLEAFMNGEPISAKPPSAIRKITRIIKRNKLSAGISAGFLVLFMLSTFLGWHYYEKGQLKPKVMAALDTLKPGETNIPDALNTLRPFFSTSVGMEILADEIISKSESHRWGAILACEETKQTQYQSQVIQAFIDTADGAVEQAAWNYIKPSPSVETIQRLIDKKSGIRNIILAETIFLEYTQKAGIDKLKEIKPQDWPDTLLQVHSKILGAEGIITYLQQFKNASDPIKKAEMLGKLPSNANWENSQALALPILIELLQKDPNQEVRRQTAYVLGQMKIILIKNNEELYNALKQALKNDSDPQVRKQCVVNLSATENKCISDVIEALKNDPDSDVKRQAIFYVKLYKAKEAFPVLKEIALNFRKDNSNYRKPGGEYVNRISYDAGIALETFGDNSGFPAILYEIIPHDYYGYGSSLFANKDDPNRSDKLKVLLDFAKNDPLPQNRTAAINCFTYSMSSEHAGEISALFETEKDPNAKNAILFYWTKVRNIQTIPALIKALNHELNDYRQLAAEALIFQHADEAMPAIKALFSNQNKSFLRPESLIAKMGEEKMESAVPFLIECLINTRGLPQLFALRSLCHINEEEAPFYILCACPFKAYPVEYLQLLDQYKIRLPYPKYREFIVSDVVCLNSLRMPYDDSIDLAITFVKGGTYPGHLGEVVPKIIEMRPTEKIPDLIEILKKPEWREYANIAQKILCGLTGEKFTEVAQWEKWWENNRDKILKDIERDKAISLKLLKEEKSPLPLIAAIKKVYRYSAKEALPDLEKIILDSTTNVEVKFHAVWILAMMKQSDNAPFFKELLSNSNQDLVQAAVWFLTELKTKGAGSDVASVLEKSPTNITILYTLDALKRLKATSAISAIDGFLAKNNNAILERAACEALQEITGVKFGNTTAEWQSWIKLNPDKLKQK